MTDLLDCQKEIQELIDSQQKEEALSRGFLSLLVNFKFFRRLNRSL